MNRRRVASALFCFSCRGCRRWFGRALRRPGGYCPYCDLRRERPAGEIVAGAAVLSAGAALAGVLLIEAIYEGQATTTDARRIARPVPGVVDAVETITKE